MIRIFYYTLISAIVLFCCFSCGNGNGKKPDSDTTKVVSNINIPEFNADSAYAFIEKQLSFGPRVPNTVAQTRCAEYFVEKFKKYTQNVIVQETKVQAFDGTMLKCKNIVASFNPENNNRIFISSHWDSRPFADNDPDKNNYNKAIDGANDGASGVGVIIELARLLSINKSPIGIDLVLFDVEDYGQPENSVLPRKEDSWCLGSQYWAKNPHVKGYYAKYGVLLDMVGAENATFTMEGTSMYFAPDVMKKVWEVAARAGYAEYFTTNRTGEITDDHLYINQLAKIPTIDIIHRDASTSGFFKYWHTVNDNIKCINKNTLKAVGQTMLTLIYEDVNS